jgi:hypothetical protein
MTTQEVLQQCTVEGNVVKLPFIQLERKLYQDVAKSLELIGGKWKGGKIFGFVFELDPTDLLDQIANGEKRNLKKEYQFFGTSDTLCDRLVAHAQLNEYDTILEPSAGQGAIIKAINKIALHIVPDCYEIMELNRVMLNKSGLKFNLIGEDFLKHSGKKYTKIIANPPFSNNQDIDHLMAMYDCLEVYGRLVCMTGNSWFIGSQKKQLEFKRWLETVDSQIIDVEAGAFKESGTNIATKIIVINK